MTMKVGIAGFRNAGKGTVAKVLQRYGFVKMSCAAPLKDMVSILFGWPRHLLEGDTSESREWRKIPDPHWQCLAGTGIFENDREITPLIVLQRIGTDLFRNKVHQDFWVILFLKRIKEIEEIYKGGVPLDNCERVPYLGVVLDDARFLNELIVCDYTIRIDRFDYTEEEVEKMHESETEHLKHKFHRVLENKGSIEDLNRDVEDSIIPILLD